MPRQTKRRWIPPMVNGLASGLRNSVCITHPPTPRDIPVSMHNTIRGRRTCASIYACVAYSPVRWAHSPNACPRTESTGTRTDPILRLTSTAVSSTSVIPATAAPGLRFIVRLGRNKTRYPGILRPTTSQSILWHSSLRQYLQTALDTDIYPTAERQCDASRRPAYLCGTHRPHGPYPPASVQ